MHSGSDPSTEHRRSRERAGAPTPRDSLPRTPHGPSRG